MKRTRAYHLTNEEVAKLREAIEGGLPWRAIAECIRWRGSIHLLNVALAAYRAEDAPMGMALRRVLVPRTGIREYTSYYPSIPPDHLSEIERMLWITYPKWLSLDDITRLMYRRYASVSDIHEGNYRTADRLLPALRRSGYDIRFVLVGRHTRRKKDKIAV